MNHLYRVCGFLIFFQICLFGNPQIVVADTASVLSELGYDESAYTLLMGWEERSQNGHGPMVYGYRIAPLNGGEAFDVYTDEAGVYLDDLALVDLEVVQKNWILRDIARDAEVSRGEKRIKAIPTPVAISLPLRSMTLAPVDVLQAVAEDEAGLSSASKGVRRVGVMRELLSPVSVVGTRVSDGAWHRLKDGRYVWQLEFVVPDALGLRIHFASLSAPEGAQLLVYNSDNTDEVYGPLRIEDDNWTPTCFSQRVTVELSLPVGESVDDVAFEIDRLTCRYRDLAGNAKQAGDCNNDWACFNEWEDAGLGVGGIGTVGSDGDLWCTGSLLADGNAGTEVPYFLTAYHCMSPGPTSTANSVEIYWFYQRNGCFGAVPEPASVPRTTGGADFLAGSNDFGGTDFALLRLRETPPSATVFLGYQESTVDIGEEVVCIHHPRGDYKRISFGNKVNTGSPQSGNQPMKPYDRFHESLWYDGTTEGGSSGSPLFLADTGRIIGQLWGGRAACSNPEEPDYYGRFDVTYPIVEQWLGTVDHPWDFNQSGAVDAADVQLVVNAALTPGDLTYDLDDSDQVDSRDIQLIVRAVLIGK